VAVEQVVNIRMLYAQLTELQTQVVVAVVVVRTLLVWLMVVQVLLSFVTQSN
jgi:hypothetical protein